MILSMFESKNKLLRLSPICHSNTTVRKLPIIKFSEVLLGTVFENENEDIEPYTFFKHILIKAKFVHFDFERRVIVIEYQDKSKAIVMEYSFEDLHNEIFVRSSRTCMIRVKCAPKCFVRECPYRKIKCAKEFHCDEFSHENKVNCRISAEDNSTYSKIGLCSAIIIDAGAKYEAFHQLVSKLVLCKFDVYNNDEVKEIKKDCNMETLKQIEQYYNKCDTEYAVKVLLSRGYRVWDAISMTNERNDCELISQSCVGNNAVVKILYEFVLLMDRNALCDFRRLIQQIKEHNQISNNILHTNSSSEDLPDERVVFVKNIVLTPAGILYMPPVAQQLSRVLKYREANADDDQNNQNTAESFLKVAIRDVDHKRLSSFTECVYYPFEYFSTILKEGIKCNDRKLRHFQFVGYSMSQLQKNGCWMYDGDSKKIHDWMGTFSNNPKIDSVVKYGARVALFFTTSRLVLKGEELESPDYCVIENSVDFPDNERACYVGGKEVKHNFTDGCGTISKAMADEVS